jgi:hypothetical protein
MKIKIKNVFEPEKEFEIGDLQDNKALELKDIPNSPNLMISAKTKDEYPFLINMSRSACLAITFLAD